MKGNHLLYHMRCGLLLLFFCYSSVQRVFFRLFIKFLLWNEFFNSFFDCFLFHFSFLVLFISFLFFYNWFFVTCNVNCKWKSIDVNSSVCLTLGSLVRMNTVEYKLKENRKPISMPAEQPLLTSWILYSVSVHRYLTNHHYFHAAALLRSPFTCIFTTCTIIISITHCNRFTLYIFSLHHISLKQ